ncbi:sigma-54-dependent transcriptional regulator [Coprothermobacter platensis]|uniref:sigma-54-dependent transcriptional regulator n=1 Tax=Coprothermobacter platensis TaxID=108819 RepID=UPI0003641BBD|nr:sigma-54 dependent transcriptional regulator [Coprothermobacter platensis]
MEKGDKKTKRVKSADEKPLILVADDEPSIRELVQTVLEQQSLRVVTAADGEKALSILNSQSVDCAVIDLRMPKVDGLGVLEQLVLKNVPTIVITAYGTSDVTIEAMRRGAYDFITKPFDIDELAEKVKKALDYSQTSDVLPIKATGEPSSLMVGMSAAMQEVYKLIGRVAPTDVTVLITGESGTGKELVSRAIHYNSPRNKGPFIVVNCAAIPQDLLESELFGYEKGAFTGADERKIGKFELANHGTILLDEIGDMTPMLQAKILRVLQEHVIERVGGTKSIPVDVRVLAATNKDLLSMVKTGLFREDLYFRLNVVQIQLPPLRERKEDIPLLADHFIKKYAAETGKDVTGVTPEVMAALMAYDYPGNVRELENVIARAVALCSGKVLTSDLLPLHVLEPQPTLRPLKSTLLEAERRAFRQAVSLVGLDAKKVADLLQIDEAHAQQRLKEWFSNVGPN